MMETSTLTLLTFLEARIAEDEAALNVRSDSPRWEFPILPPNPPVTRRQRREVEAKRAILQRWQYRWQEAESAKPEIHSMLASQATGLGNAVAFIAAVYADHPDYLDEWRA